MKLVFNFSHCSIFCISPQTWSSEKYAYIKPLLAYSSKPKLTIWNRGIWNRRWAVKIFQMNRNMSIHSPLHLRGSVNESKHCASNREPSHGNYGDESKITTGDGRLHGNLGIIRNQSGNFSKKWTWLTTFIYKTSLKQDWMIFERFFSVDFNNFGGDIRFVDFCKLYS